MASERFGGKGMPSGWFQIAWSDQIPPGGVVPLRYFGRELVLARTESGELNLFDAYCPHLGAHLGHGGCMQGEALVCPYHGWEWGPDGRNVGIPYADKPNRSKSLTKWHVAEVGRSIVMAWYHPDGRAPDHPCVEIPELGRDDHYPLYPACTKHYTELAMHPEWVAENIVDMAHFRFVHRTPQIARMVDADVRGPNLQVRFVMPMKHFDEATTRGSGAHNIVDALADVTAWGTGMLVIRFDLDDSIQLQAQTPVDEDTCEIFAGVIVPRGADATGDAPTGAGMARVNMELRQVENDLVIWSHRRMEPHPALTLDEARPFKMFADWKKQFYPPASGSASASSVSLASSASSA